MRLGYLASENGFDFSVDGHVRLFKTVNGIGCAGHLRKMQETADVVVLIECAEHAFRVISLQAKIRQRREKSETARSRWRRAGGCWRWGHTCRPSVPRSQPHSPLITARLA